MYRPKISESTCTGLNKAKETQLIVKNRGSENLLAAYGPKPR